MKKLLSYLPCLLLASVSFAKADTLTFNSSPSGSVGPYGMTLKDNGTSTALNLFCVNSDRTIYLNETWGVDVVNGAKLSFTGSALKPFQEEAYIYEHQAGYTNAEIQKALWNTNTAQGLTGNALKLYNAAVSNYASADLSQVTFYLYDSADGLPRVDGKIVCTPQNFIGGGGLAPTPEPSSLVLLGTGAMSLFGFARRKFASA